MGAHMQKSIMCTSLNDLESDYTWSRLKDENSPIPEFNTNAERKPSNRITMKTLQRNCFSD